MSEQEHHVPPEADQGPGASGGASNTGSAWAGEGGSGPGCAPLADAGRQGPDAWEGYSIEVLRAVLDP
jgi:hypothetical protein